MLEYLIEAFRGPGAPFMYAITALMAFAMAVLLERLLTLLKARPDADAALAALDRGDLTAAAAGDTPLASVLRAGAAEPDVDRAWEAMGAAAAAAEGTLRKRVDSLSAISNLATMLGLLGTVYGLILAFSALGDAAAGERAARLSQGISTAMATTAYGLMVAIPALGVHTWLSGVADARINEIEVAAGRLALALRRGRSDG